jgi:NTP pyrophosphatase (non-canonical NTP hydrolase)
MKDIISECANITKSKGFRTDQHLKQILLIGTEVAEALEHLIITNEKETEDEEYYLGLLKFKFEKMMNVFNEKRKEIDFVDNSEILNKEKLSEELADICIRVFSYCGSNDIDLEEQILKKMEINRKRPILHGNKF